MQEVIFNKNALRKKAKDYRKSLTKSDKSKKDNIIFEKIVSLNEFKNAKTVLCYVSSETEADTVRLIEYCFKIKKKVAVPRCEERDGEMNFHYISSLNELKNGKFNINEPPKDNDIFKNAENSICIVPSLMADRRNYRLGYGKGYYDRYLKNFSGVKCLICYKDNIVDKLPVFENFDIACDILITD